MKKLLLCLLSLGFVVGLTAGCGKKDDTDDTKTPEVEENEVLSNDNEGVTKSQVVGNLEFHGATLVWKDNQSEFSVLIKNNSDVSVSLEMVTVRCENENGSEVIQLPFYVGDSIEAGAERLVSTKTNMNLMNVTSVEYSV